MGITIVGLGPGNGRFLTREAWELLAGAPRVYLRTSRHPAVSDLRAAVARISFDHVYDTADDFAQVYGQIVEELLRLGRAADIVYAVPGHPYVGEATVTRLVAAARVEDLPVRIVAGLSFVEPTLTAVGTDALDGLQIYDALDINAFLYPPASPDAPLLLAQVYSRFVAGEIKLVLMSVYPDEHEVFLVHAAGEPDERVEQVPLYAIDRSEHIDHLTSLYVPPLPAASSLQALAETVAVLRSPEGCPWDQEQTPQSMRAGLLEEAYEVLEALDADDPDSLREELGDLLYHLVMQAQMAAEVGDFTLTDVIAGIEAKLKYRHPHVWGDWEVSDTAEVLRNWEMLKQQEKTAVADSLLDGVPPALPALAHSQKLQSRAAKVGFDWPEIGGVFDKLAEETAELHDARTREERQAELGDLLFVAVNLARWLGVDAETALREANRRFVQRFQAVEEMIVARAIGWETLDLDALNVLWEEAKKTLAKQDQPDKLG